MASLYEITKGEDVEFFRILSKRGLDAEMARTLIKRPELADTMIAALREQLSPHARKIDYSSHLLSLEDQLARIVQFDKDYWDGWLGQRVRLGTIPTGSFHFQSVDDLEIFYVDFGSPEKNVEMWWKAIAGIQPNTWRNPDLKTDPEHLRLAPGTRQYEPGIYPVRINLVAHWEPENGRSVDQVREQASRFGETLAAAEVLAAYGLHDVLLRQMDGENLPFADLAGFWATLPGSDPWVCCPYLSWGRDGRGVGLGTLWADDVDNNWAAPVLRKS